MSTFTRTPRLAGVLVQPQPGYAFGHDCQLSKSRRITACTDPNHQRDAAQLRQALIVLGVIPDPIPSAERDANGHLKTARGRCPVCRRRRNVTTEGRLYKHPARGGEGDCAGSGGLPEQREVAA